MNAGGTVPWTEPVEPSLEQRPSATHGAVAENEVKPNKFEISIIALGIVLGFTSFYPTHAPTMLIYKRFFSSCLFSIHKLFDVIKHPFWRIDGKIMPGFLVGFQAGTEIGGNL